MITIADELEPVVESLAALRREMAALADRVAALERTAAPAAADSGEISPEIAAVIAAVLAAHLGVKPHIRQVTLVGGSSWAQQGRVTIQASHRLAFQRD